jgi:hypothetical protein
MRIGAELSWDARAWRQVPVTSVGWRPFIFYAHSMQTDSMQTDLPPWSRHLPDPPL